MKVHVEEIGNMYCHKKGAGNLICKGPKCMAWEWVYDHVKVKEIGSPHYTTQDVKTDKGYCKLVYR